MSEHQVGLAGTLLQNGQMTRLDVAGTAVVLARVDGQYYAFGGACTHYGAPLDKGVLKGHDLMCPHHHACFDIRSGARKEPPALDDLPHYPVRVEAGQVVIVLPHANAVEPHGRADASDPRTFVIVGGGAAGSAAVEELRRSGYRGKIILLSQAATGPLDRPNLSKGYLAGHAEPDWIPLRSGEKWYADRDIDLRLNTEITRIDARTHTVYLATGSTIHYDKLLLAMGSTPRQLTGVPGIELDGIFTLRSLADADRIIGAAQKGKHAVIVGSSFIGMEVATSLVGGREVAATVVGLEAIPFERILGPEVGRMFQQEHAAHGVQFRLSSEVRRMIGTAGHVSAVELKSGELIPADFVVVGVGVRPATDFLRDSGLALDPKDQSVHVNSLLQSSDPDIYAAGDIARWSEAAGTSLRIEHWRTAQQQGIVAALNMLGQAEGVNHHVPFFWTIQWDIHLRYVGHATAWDEIIYREGRPEQKAFIALYVKDGKLHAAAGCQRDPQMDAVEFILRDDMPLSLAQMRDDSFDLVAYVGGAYARR